MSAKSTVSICAALLFLQVCNAFPQAAPNDDNNEYKVTIKAKVGNNLEAFSLSGKDCQNFHFDIPVTAINTYDTCAQLYTQNHCQGEAIRQEATQREAIFSKQVASVGPCPIDTGDELGTSWENMRRFLPPTFQELVAPWDTHIGNDASWGVKTPEATATMATTTEAATTTTEATEAPRVENVELRNVPFPKFKHWRHNYDENAKDSFDKIFDSSESDEPAPKLFGVNFI